MKDNFLNFQNDFVAKWQEYRDLQTELQKYAGKEIGSNVGEVNALLNKIQDNFASMYPAMEFVIHNYKLCVAAVNDYNAFIEDLKKEGASPSPIIEA
jgi:translation elongation factor EF-Ts